MRNVQQGDYENWSWDLLAIYTKFAVCWELKHLSLDSCLWISGISFLHSHIATNHRICCTLESSHHDHLSMVTYHIASFNSSKKNLSKLSMHENKHTFRTTVQLIIYLTWHNAILSLYITWHPTTQVLCREEFNNDRFWKPQKRNKSPMFLCFPLWAYHASAL